ncbi:nuclear transport factor 2 family protein [Actinomadura macra]|uniref:nuclear transport factor 2 family protein n=1 Tax=Actinomadura macra TaxID=46164 RepID=UPI00082C59B7|nr:nuclear transport factor 2 family protein [Actinomadura macra]
MTDPATRLDELERRLRALEDEREITRLILSYGPLVDCGAADGVAALWAAEGVYDVDELMMDGHAEIEAMVRSANHRRWIEGGCAHVVGPPHVSVSGDQAAAVGYTLMIVNGPDGFAVHRATANHWLLRRTPGGWRALRRTNRVLDGRAESPALLRRVADGPSRAASGTG